MSLENPPSQDPQCPDLEENPTEVLSESVLQLLESLTVARSNPFVKQTDGMSVGPVVLETVEPGSVLEQAPATVLCPGCGDIIDRYIEGVSQRLAHFERECASCEVTILRWSSVVVTTALEQAVSVEHLQDVVTSYWDRHLWDGIVTGERCARTAEYTRAYTAAAAAFGWDWDVRCPLCRQSLASLGISRLDYHHWQHNPDKGVCLCRTCHKAISGGMSDERLDWCAQELGLGDKHDMQLTRIALRELAATPTPVETLQDVVELLRDRYNVPYSRAELYVLLNQTLTTRVVLEEISDEYLLDGLQGKSSN